MQAIRVGKVGLVISAAPSYLEQHGIPQNPGELTAHSIISTRAVTPIPEW
jgi:hypothetical protein